jgi:carboxypeptidase PM20D1
VRKNSVIRLINFFFYTFSEKRMQILKYLQLLLSGITGRSVAPESTGGLPHNNISVERIIDSDTIHIPECAIMLSDYIKHISVSGNEGAAGQFFADFCRSKGMHVEIFTRENDSFNFAASLYPLSIGKPNIILLNHIDVVPAEDFQRWTYPPFSGIIADGHVWGRGAYDSKGLGVMQLFAVLKYVKKAMDEDLPYNVTVLCVSGEETGGEKGAGIVSEVFLEQLNPIVVYGEGGAGIKGASQAYPERSFFGITTSQKRILWWEMKSEIPATGHGSVPTGENATRELIAAVQKVLEKKPPLKFTPISKNMLRVLGRNERGIRGFVLRNIGLFSRLIGNTLRKEPLIAALLTDTTSLLGIYSTPGAAN